ncbi:helix-turn-helix domain-containing protein [Gimesia sp.]|uniref:helix-turn-helix domain-containing protein n=1 Tax=Gimesia sp. TaxID=2024833 RepID=UPI0032EE29DA
MLGELPDYDEVLSAAESAVGQCCVMHGAHVQYANIAGQKVEDVRKTFQGLFHIPDSAKTFVGGEEVSGDHIISQGQTLEFAKQSGEKGLGNFYTQEKLMEFWEISGEQYSKLLQMGLPKVILEGSTLHSEVAVDEWFKLNASRQEQHEFEELARPKDESPAEIKTQSLEGERLHSIERQLTEVRSLLQRSHQQSIVKEFYTVKEAAEKVGLAPWTIRQACNKGRISDAKKHPRSGDWRIPHQSITQIQNEGMPD